MKSKILCNVSNIFVGVLASVFFSASDVMPFLKWGKWEFVNEIVENFGFVC